MSHTTAYTATTPSTARAASMLTATSTNMEHAAAKKVNIPANW